MNGDVAGKALGPHNILAVLAILLLTLGCLP